MKKPQIRFGRASAYQIALLFALLSFFAVLLTVTAATEKASGLETRTPTPTLIPSPTPPCGPAALDTTFNGTGKVLTNLNGADRAYSVAIQADGKIVAAGYTYFQAVPGYDFALARYNTDGSLDSSFNGTGKVITNLGSDLDIAYSVAIQIDGKIVAAGSISNGTNLDFALVRYNADGSLDNSFNGTGKVITDLGGQDTAKSVAIQADGKIVAAGYTYNSISVTFALVRYNTDGSLDNSFNGTGRVITNLTGHDFAYSVAIQADGKIVAAGYIHDNASNVDFALVRYNTNGSLDNSFNGTGKVITDVNGNDIAYSVAIQADGKIVAAGVAGIGFGLVRYNADGSLDSSFNGTGKVITNLNGTDAASSVAIQADGKIVAAGNTGINGSNNDFALVRYNTDGSLDSSFNGAGMVITNVNGDDYANSVAIQADGKIVAAGHVDNNGLGDDFALVRYGVPCATPTATPTPTSTACPPFNVTGTVGQCTTAGPSGIAFPGVILTLTSSQGESSTTTDSSGSYFLSGFSCVTNTVTPSKAALQPGSNGIDTVDVVAVRRHFLQIGTPLSGCRLTAADCAPPVGVDTVDVIAIQRYFLGLSTETGNVGQYSFTPASRSYAPPISNQTDQNYNAIVFGDVAPPFAAR